jgi:F-type H+-transporting ATPase subunit delta
MGHFPVFRYQGIADLLSFPRGFGTFGRDILKQEVALAAENSISSGFAGRYATALFELAKEAGVIDSVVADLSAFDTLVGSHEDMQRFVRSPVFSAEEQVAALRPILEKIGIQGLAQKFLLMVATQRRLFAVRAMVRAFRQLVDQDRGVVRATVTLAETPSSSALEAIKTALKDVAGAGAAIDLEVDPEIIGGIIVQIGSKMVDSSLRTKLNGIRTAMKEVG